VAPPGVAPAAFLHVEKRQSPCVIVLGAKSNTFGLTEDVLRAAADWRRRPLAPQADRGAVSPTARKPSNRAACSPARRRPGPPQRSGEELNSPSGQLANTYELSLIYQVSSGMKINRRALTSSARRLDLIEVMNVRGRASC
jgi:hypothetical protein